MFIRKRVRFLEVNADIKLKNNLTLKSTESVLARPSSASPVDSVPQKSGQKLHGPWLQLRLWILFRPTSSCGTRCVLKFSLSSNFLHRAGWELTRGGSLASGRLGLGLDSGCLSFYNNFQILSLVFFATAIYLHRLCFSPVKLALGQPRKKPEATAGLASEMVLGATTWLVSSQRESCRGHVFFRFGGTRAF